MLHRIFGKPETKAAPPILRLVGDPFGLQVCMEMDVAVAYGSPHTITLHPVLAEVPHSRPSCSEGGSNDVIISRADDIAKVFSDSLQRLAIARNGVGIPPGLNRGLREAFLTLPQALATFFSTSPESQRLQVRWECVFDSELQLDSTFGQARLITRCDESTGTPYDMPLEPELLFFGRGRAANGDIYHSASFFGTTATQRAASEDIEDEEEDETPTTSQAGSSVIFQTQPNGAISYGDVVAVVNVPCSYAVDVSSPSRHDPAAVSRPATETIVGRRATRGILSLAMIRRWQQLPDSAAVDKPAPLRPGESLKQQAARRQRQKFTCSLAQMKYGSIHTVVASQSTVVVPVSQILACVYRIKDHSWEHQQRPRGLRTYLLTRAPSHALFYNNVHFAAARKAAL